MLWEMLGELFSRVLYLILNVSGGSFPRPLSAAEEAECLRRLALGDIEARNTLIEHNLRLVAHIIKKYYASWSDQEDLVSIGTIGLIKAVNTFDASKGARLSSYAARCIENEVLMHFRNGRKSAQDVSISDPIDMDKDGNTLTLIDVISCDDTIVEDLDLKIKAEQLHEYLGQVLDEREREIILLRYGIGGGNALTQRIVAKKLGISRSYVSRIEKKALEKLRRRFDSAAAAAKRSGAAHKPGKK